MVGETPTTRVKDFSTSVEMTIYQKALHLSAGVLTRRKKQSHIQSIGWYPHLHTFYRLVSSPAEKKLS